MNTINNLCYFEYKKTIVSPMPSGIKCTKSIAATTQMQLQQHTQCKYKQVTAEITTSFFFYTAYCVESLKQKTYANNMLFEQLKFKIKCSTYTNKSFGRIDRIFFQQFLSYMFVYYCSEKFILFKLVIALRFSSNIILTRDILWFQEMI